MSRPGSIVVVGAGIVGVSSAIWLRRAGIEVTLIDRLEPGMGTSYGNAGVLAACSVAPVTGPGLIGKAPGLLLDPNFPLFLRWLYLPRLLPWLVRYLSHANDADTRRIARDLAPITSDSVEQHRALAGETGAADWLQDSFYSFAYRSRADFDADSYVWDLRREAGFVPDLVEGEAVRDVEPALGPSIGLLAMMKHHGYILDPAKYVQALAQELVRSGGTIARADVKDFELQKGRVHKVLTDQGPFECDGVVMATGAWSNELMLKLGLSVPLESERGYHIVFKSPSIRLTHPIMVASGKFVATPMAEGMRCAGIVEFGGLEAEPSRAPLALLRKQVRQTFPMLDYESEEEWLGHRPAPSDSLPLIGEIGKTGIYSAYGHHHIGLTGGPKTGRLIADMIVGVPLNIDVSRYQPDRFLQ